MTDRTNQEPSQIDLPSQQHVFKESNHSSTEITTTCRSLKSTVVGDEESQTINTDNVTYIDFLPPPPPPVPPPAKYKLWMLILVLVYLGVWFAEEAQVVPALTFNGWFGTNAALFIFMILHISVATYAALDTLVHIFTIQFNGQKYGIEAWLKGGRTHVSLRKAFDGKENF